MTRGSPALDPPLRIVLAPSAYSPHVGGIEETTRQLAIVFRQRGHDVLGADESVARRSSRTQVARDVDVTRLAFPLPATNSRSAAQFLTRAPAAVAAMLRHL